MFMFKKKTMHPFSRYTVTVWKRKLIQLIEDFYNCNNAVIKIKANFDIYN